MQIYKFAYYIKYILANKRVLKKQYKLRFFIILYNYNSLIILLII